VVLAIDDYHLIGDPDIHAGMAFLIERSPAALEVVIATRREPALPLARLRARGELAELDARGLRFSHDEAAALVNDLHGLGLRDADVERLRERTEGWAAGLYLAVMSLRGRDDPERFIATFAGDDRHIVDYLGSEVLAEEGEEMRSFLLRTSVLDRFCASLCRVVTGDETAGRLLAELERSNQFLVPLDARREWYRYHHLFRELLLHELRLDSPESEPELHRRAAGWLLEAGSVSEAIHHTIAAGDLGAAGDLIARHWALVLLGSAGDRTIDSWLEALPAEAVCADVRLCFARCFASLSLGRMDEVEHWLAAGEEAPQPGPFMDGAASKEGAMACVRAALLWEVGDVDGAMRAGRQAREAERGSPWESIGVACIGLAHAARAEWREGGRWMDEYARIGRESGHHLNQVSGLATAAACQAELREWEAAAAKAEDSLELAARHGIDEHWCTSHAHLARALLLDRDGDAAAAERELERSVELARRGSGPVYTLWPLLHLAAARAAHGDAEAARTALDEARGELDHARDPGPMAERFAEVEKRVSGRAARLPADGDPLSERELAVLRLLATELSQREIGRELYLSVNTVKTHARNVFRKLGASSRDEAVARARERALI
jgi:LuxR family transcriptional regulator, maltose regulon positive regulatory protein